MFQVVQAYNIQPQDLFVMLKREASRVVDTLSCSNKQYYINLHPTKDSSVAGVLWLLIFCGMSQMRRRTEANPRRVDTEEKKTSIILSLQVLKLVTFSCYWAANISLSRNWMSILTSSTMMETMIRFTLCNCETAGLHTEGLCLFVWCGGNGNAWLFRKERGRELW